MERGGPGVAHPAAESFAVAVVAVARRQVWPIVAAGAGRVFVCQVCMVWCLVAILSVLLRMASTVWVWQLVAHAGAVCVLSCNCSDRIGQHLSARVDCSRLGCLAGSRRRRQGCVVGPRSILYHHAWLASCLLVLHVRVFGFSRAGSFNLHRRL